MNWGSSRAGSAREGGAYLVILADRETLDAVLLTEILGEGGRHDLAPGGGVGSEVSLKHSV